MTDEELKAEFALLREHVTAECEKVETKLLSAFHGWARSMEVRMRGAVAVVSGFEERLTFIEERIGELERRRHGN